METTGRTEVTSDERERGMVMSTEFILRILEVSGIDSGEGSITL